MAGSWLMMIQSEDMDDMDDKIIVATGMRGAAGFATGRNLAGTNGHFPAFLPAYMRYLYRFLLIIHISDLPNPIRLASPFRLMAHHENH